MISNQQGHIVVDDTVLDKRYSFNIEFVRWQYGENAHQVIKGISVVNCIYVNPIVGQFWMIDCRIYNPEEDGQTKLDHV